MRRTCRRARRAVLLELREPIRGLNYGFLVAVESFFAALFLTTLLSRRLLRRRARRSLLGRAAALSAVLARSSPGGRLRSRLRGLLAPAAALSACLRGRLGGGGGLLGAVLLVAPCAWSLVPATNSNAAARQSKTLHVERPPEVGICPWVCPLIRGASLLFERTDPEVNWESGMNDPGNRPVRHIRRFIAPKPPDGGGQIVIGTTVAVAQSAPRPARNPPSFRSGRRRCRRRAR